MNCTRCGREGVVLGSRCPGCGSVVVAPDVLDSVLSLPAEEIPEEWDDEPTSVPRLMVRPGSTGAATELDDEPAASAAFDEEPAAPEVEPEVALEPGDGPTPPEPAPPLLPQRTPLAATTPQWGPRQHPPAVLAPPPPHPLDAPAVAKVRQPSGTGLPAGLAAGGPAAVPVAPREPTPPPVPPAMAAPVPERPNHPRVRRWFGRGTEPEPAVEAEPAAAAPDEPPAPVPEAFAGAPEGLLAGVTPDTDLGPGVHDPAGIEAAMSRLSAGARRSALAPMTVVAALLEPGEVAEAVVQGDHQHRPAVVVLTDRRVIVANDRRWAPDVRTFGFDPQLVVHGWQDDRRATLVFVLDGVGVVVDAISDRPLARDLAQRVRGRCAGGPPGVDPPP